MEQPSVGVGAQHFRNDEPQWDDSSAMTDR